MSSSFRDLRVWRQAMELVVAAYGETRGFPKDETYGLTGQMRRAAVSIPSNIAEGKGMNSDAEFRQFLYHARGSLMELQTQVLIAQQLQYLSKEKAESLLERCTATGRSLAGLINSLKAQAAASNR
jgi:four helix bundle protein